MKTIQTEAWVLYNSECDPYPDKLIPLHKETITFSDITDEEILIEPLIGCWAANMAHALSRKPIDICQQRGEEKVILGNSGVVRVLKVGKSVSTVSEGDICVFFGNSISDKYGYTKLIHAYDAPGTVGLLAKKLKAKAKNVLLIPKNTPHTLAQWAAFSGRYITAWANWGVAYQCWQTQMSEVTPEEIYVVGWGGGTTLAELALAKTYGCQALMLASIPSRLQQIAQLGITPIDRRPFSELHYDPLQYKSDVTYRQAYKQLETYFLEAIHKHTNGNMASIFIDNIGAPVFRATLKALARQGVITTAGWKLGMEVSILRAIEAIKRHIHVFTHQARYKEALGAIQFAIDNQWLPPTFVLSDIYPWDSIPDLAHRYQNGQEHSYFPVFAVNEI